MRARPARLTKLALKHSGSLSSRLRLLLSVLLTVIRDGLHTSDSASNSQAHSHSDLDSEAASAIKAGTACEPVQVRTPEDVKQLRDAERIRRVPLLPTLADPCSDRALRRAPRAGRFSRWCAR